MQQNNIEQIKKIGLIIAAIISIVVLGKILLNTTSEKITSDVSAVNHDIFTYKQDGSLSIYNTKDKKYLSTLKASNVSKSLDDEGYKNFFNVEHYNEKYVLASPSTSELLIISAKDDNLVKEKAITVNGTVENFKIDDTKAFVQYSNTNTLEIFDLNSSSLEEKIEFKENTSCIEVDKENIYVGAGDYIYIMSRKMLDIEKADKIYIGSKATSIMKSENGFLYIGTDFGSDSNTSVLVKVDIKNKNIDNILNLNKEYPIDILEKGDYIYVLCKGITDTTLDGIAIINKDTLEKFKSISTGNTPNSMFFTEDGYIYTSHDDGAVVAINAKNDFNVENNFVIQGVKEIAFASKSKENK